MHFWQKHAEKKKICLVHVGGKGGLKKRPLYVLKCEWSPNVVYV